MLGGVALAWVVFQIYTASVLSFTLNADNERTIHLAFAQLLISFMLFNFGYWLNKAKAPYVQTDPTQILQLATEAEDGGVLRAVVQGRTSEPVRSPLQLSCFWVKSIR